MGGEDTIRGITVQLAVACELAVAVAVDDRLTALRVEGADDIADLELRADDRLVRLVQVKSRAEHRLFSPAEVAELVRRCAAVDAETYELVTDAGVSRDARQAILGPAEALADGRPLSPSQLATLERLGLGEYLDVLMRFAVRPRWGDPQFLLDRPIVALHEALGERPMGADQARTRIERLFAVLTVTGGQGRLANRTVSAAALRELLGITSLGTANLPSDPGEALTKRLPPTDRTLLRRAETLESALRHLEVGRPRVLALTGLPGCGKTELAIELADAVKDKFNVVWWLDAERDASMIDGLRGLLASLGTAEADAADDAQVLMLVRAELRRRQPWLLVFDNIPGPGALRRAGLAGEGGHLLVTSRHPGWTSWGATLEVALFSEDEAVELLLRHRPLELRPALARLAAALGHLPLAVAQAAAYLDHSTRTVEDFRDLLERRLALLDSHQAAADAEGRYQRTVVTMLGLLLEQLEEPNISALVGLLAQLGPEPVPLELLGQVASTAPTPLRALLDDEVALEQALAELNAAAVVRMHATGPTMHRLTARAAREQLDDRGDRRLALCALEAVDELFPDDALQPSTWAATARLIPHAHALLDRADLLASQRGGWLAVRVSALDHIQGRLAEAVELAERALKLLPDDDCERLRAALLHTVGRAGVKSGRIPEAVDPLTGALAALDRLGAGETIEYATVEVTLGAVLSALGVPEAGPRLEHALDVLRRELPAEDKRIARAMIELASNVGTNGDLRGAERLEREALAIVDRPGADAGVDLARALGNLAGTLSEFPEQNQETRQIAQRALEVTRDVYGPEHPEVAYPLTTLGSLIADQDPQEGFDLLLEALRLRLSAFDAHHEEVAYTLDHLGRTLSHADEPARALVWLRQAYALLEDTFGDNHVEVASTAFELAQVLTKLGQCRAARPLIVGAMAAIAQAWGDNHPDVATARRALEELDGLAGPRPLGDDLAPD